jgi:hypothetical protein
MLGVACLAFVACGLNPERATAQPATATTSGYITEAPNNPLWLALATAAGRWAIQLAADCTAIAPGMNVTVVGRLDDSDVQLISDAGESCGLTSTVRMGTLPCSLDASGRCDLRGSD